MCTPLPRSSNPGMVELAKLALSSWSSMRLLTSLAFASALSAPTCRADTCDGMRQGGMGVRSVDHLKLGNQSLALLRMPEALFKEPLQLGRHRTSKDWQLGGRKGPNANWQVTWPWTF